MDYTILINKENLLDCDYIPSDLIQTDNNENNFHRYKDPNQKPMISAIVYPFFLQMQEAAKQEGNYIIIDSGYRSFKYQQVIWDKYVSEHGLENAQKFVALPGSSEHQSGLAFDVAFIRDNKYDDDVKEEDKEIQWLFAHAHEYGFILRYPKGKETITGYNYEPWHFRFVGKELATKIYTEGITLEEYFARKNERKI